MQRPRVSADRRRLALPDGSPFFWLGDTAWELFHRLSKDEAEEYLSSRAAQGFNVVQAVALAEEDGLRVPNREGHVPFADLDPEKPNEAYWKHVDWVLDRAERHGLYVGLLPTWGDKINQTQWGKGPIVFDPPKALAYARWLGHRVAHRNNVIWVNGGDRNPGDKKGVYRALAQGLREGDDSHERLMTFHPAGERSSADDFHDEGWLDLNMMQTGHGADLAKVRQMMRATYERTPAKPVLDGEPRYENHPVGFDMHRGYFDAGDVRQGCYTGVFLGGAGVTYGCHAIWQFAQDRYPPVNNPISHWRHSLNLPGANQMRHLKELALSLPFLEMRPDFDAPMPTLVGGGKVAVYSPEGAPVERAGLTEAEWFDPTTGQRQPAGGPIPPTRDGRVKDWVLIGEGTRSV